MSMSMSMSRFEPNLTALSVDKWAQIQKNLDEASSKVPSGDANLVAEFSRLSRVIEFLSATVESAYPFAEFLNGAIQNQVTNFEIRINQLRNYSPNQLQSVLPQLNDEATSILERLSPYLSNAESARAAGQAFGRFRKLAETQEREILEIRANIDQGLADVKSAADEIKKFRIELLEGTEKQESIRVEIKQKITQIDKMLSDTETFYRKLKLGDSDSISIEHQILHAGKKAEEDSKAITEQLTATKNKLSELERIYSEVFGLKADANEHTEEKGLKAELEARRDQLNAMGSQFEGKFKSLQEQIESLLPGATSAGLATAYNNRRKKAESDAQFYSRAFFIGIILLALSAAATITQSFTLWPFSWVLISFESAKEYFDKLLFKLPLVIPVLWATLTVSKRRSEMHRLAEEYAHKEALAQSYEGFKKQISDLNKDDSQLIQNLLEVILKAISLNAATTLEGRHGEKTPIQEVIETAIKNAMPK